MTTTTLPVVAIGGASKGPTNEPVLIQTMSDFVETFGYEGDFTKYTLEEVAYVFFQLYNVRPFVAIRVGGTTVRKADILGGVTAGKETGLYVLENVYPKLGMVPSTLIAPKWSTDPEIALAMAARCRLINGVFKAIALVDVDISAVTLEDQPALTSTNPIGFRRTRRL